MALNDIFFLIGQPEHSFGVVACNAWMLEAVPVGDVAAMVPVIQIKIMQERAFYKAFLIGVDTQMNVEPERNAGDPHTVLIGCDTAVLDELFHFLRGGVIRNAAQKQVHPHLFLRG